MFPATTSNRHRLRALLACLLIAGLACLSGCELDGMYSGVHDLGGPPQETAQMKSEAEEAELEEAAMLRVQELLAEDSSAASVAAEQPAGDAHPTRPVRLSSLFVALSNQARRMGGRLIVP